MTQATSPSLPEAFQNSSIKVQNIPKKVEECLIQCYDLYFKLFKTPILPETHNVLHELLNQHLNKLKPIREEFGRKTIYQAYILEFNRIRNTNYLIRWWRRDWYGKEDTDPISYMWKNFVQHIGTFHKCSRHNCSFKQIEPGKCPTHQLTLIRKWSDNTEYKTLNGALSNLCNKGVTSYFNLRILDISMKSPIRLVNECFNHEKGFPLIILFVEKGTLIKIEFLKHFKRFGIIPYPSSGQSTIQADELLVHILKGTLCQRCFKEKKDVTWLDDCWHKFYEPDQDIYLFSVTDYDPIGFSIANTIYKHLKNNHPSIIHKRIGITKKQIESWNLSSDKYHVLPERYQKWEEAFIFDNIAYGVELDQLPKFETEYFRFILEFILEKIGMEGWNDYAKNESENQWEEELDELLTEIATELTKKHDPLYLLHETQIDEIREIINYLESKITTLETHQEKLYDPYYEAIKEYLEQEAPEEEDDFDEREEIEEKVIYTMHEDQTYFSSAVEHHYDYNSFLHNNNLLDKIRTLIEENEDEIIELKEKK